MTSARRQIIESDLIFKDIIQGNLRSISDDTISQLVNSYKKLSRKEQPNAVNSVTLHGQGLYKTELRAAAATIAFEAMTEAAKELDMAIGDFKLSEEIQFGDFDKLPKGLKTRVASRVSLTIGAQIADMEKTIFFEYLDEIDRTDSLDKIEEAMQDSAEKYITGSSVSTGSQLLSSYTVNDSRAAVFFSDTGKENMDALRFDNPSPVADICVNLNGQIFSADQKSASQYFPPLHFNCKSVLIPIPSGKLGNRKITKLQPKGTPTEIADANKSKQFSENSNIVKCPCCG